MLDFYLWNSLRFFRVFSSTTTGRCALKVRYSFTYSPNGNAGLERWDGSLTRTKQPLYVNSVALSGRDALLDEWSRTRCYALLHPGVNRSPSDYMANGFYKHVLFTPAGQTHARTQGLHACTHSATYTSDWCTHVYIVTVQTHHMDAYKHATTHVPIYIQGCSPCYTHRADLFAATVVMKVVAVEADEGAIYCVFFHGWIPQEGKNKLNARFVPLARRIYLKFNSSRERRCSKKTTENLSVRLRKVR